LIFCGTLSWCQQPAQSATVRQPAPDWRVSWRNATVAFGEVKHDALLGDYFSAVGTGVIVRAGEHKGYIVTAKHMFCDPEKRWYPRKLNIRFSWEDRKSIYTFVGITILVRDDAGAPLWTAPDDDSDIAALPITPEGLNALLPADDRKQNIEVIGTEDFDGDLYEGEQVFIFGYPAVAGNDYLARMIVRQGIVAWTNPNDTTVNTFLVDANLYPGNSGGPVIMFPFGLKKDGGINILGGKPALLGIVSQGAAQDIQATVSGPRGPIAMHAPVVGIGAVGVIEPASKIAKLLSVVQAGASKTPTCGVNEVGQRR